ncbi:hypothetical protein U1Q18_022854 [Sarracenia purpurea var. burkii]
MWLSRFVLVGRPCDGVNLMVFPLVAVLMFFYERYLIVAPKQEVFETSGSLKSCSARWMEKCSDGSLLAVVDRELEFVFRPYLQLVDAVMPCICDHDICNVEDVEITHGNAHTICVLGDARRGCCFDVSRLVSRSY